MPKDYTHGIIICHCSFVWSYNNENVYFRWFTLCVQNTYNNKIVEHVILYNTVFALKKCLGVY